MRIESPDGQSFELRVIGYQYPFGQEGWVVIEANVTYPLGSWHLRDPCMTAGEVASLALWLRALALGTLHRGGYSRATQFDFIEPNFTFTAEPDEAPVTLRISFDLEAGEALGDMFLEFPLRRDWLLETAAELENQLAKLPPTAVWSGPDDA